MHRAMSMHALLLPLLRFCLFLYSLVELGYEFSFLWWLFSFRSETENDGLLLWFLSFFFLAPVDDDGWMPVEAVVASLQCCSTMPCLHLLYFSSVFNSEIWRDERAWGSAGARPKPVSPQ